MGNGSVGSLRGMGWRGTYNKHYEAPCHPRFVNSSRRRRPSPGRHTDGVTASTVVGQVQPGSRL